MEKEPQSPNIVRELFYKPGEEGSDGVQVVHSLYRSGRITLKLSAVQVKISNHSVCYDENLHSVIVNKSRRTSTIVFISHDRESIFATFRHDKSPLKIQFNKLP